MTIRILFCSPWTRRWVMLFKKGTEGNVGPVPQAESKVYPWWIWLILTKPGTHHLVFIFERHKGEETCGLSLFLCKLGTMFWVIKFSQVLETCQGNQGWKQVSILFTSEMRMGNGPVAGLCTSLQKTNQPFLLPSHRWRSCCIFSFHKSCLCSCSWEK